MKVEFYRHSLGEAEIASVTDVLRSLFLTTGAQVAAFEERFASYLGVGKVVGVTSCTSALHLALLALGVGPGDEVITCPATFAATGNAIIHAGARPVFVDAEPTTGNLDAARVEAALTPRTKAIMPVHLYGVLCDMKAITEIAQAHGLKVIEDSAHAVESIRDGYRSGNLADAACFSFYATKNLSCGEGGAVAVNDPAVDDRLRLLRLHGMSKSAADRYHGRYQHWDLELLGYKANMSNLQAALLLPQLDLLDERLKRREQIARRYEEAFAEVDGIDFPRVPEGAVSARHLFTIWVPEGRRDEILWGLQERNVGVAVNFRPIHLLRYYVETFGYERGSFPVAEEIGDRTISIPMYPGLTDEEVEYVIEQIVQVVGG